MKNQLKVLRAMRNWSQAELGEHLDVSRQAVNAGSRGHVFTSENGTPAIRVILLQAAPDRRARRFRARGIVW